MANSRIAQFTTPCRAMMPPGLAAVSTPLCTCGKL
jgi:hypothetical protein